jgi:hypothetical protein
VHPLHTSPPRRTRAAVAPHARTRFFAASSGALSIRTGRKESCAFPLDEDGLRRVDTDDDQDQDQD